MLIVLVVGIAALVTVVVAGVAYHRAPTRITCPTCSRTTSPVRPPGVLGRTPGVTWRWCAACGWEGVGRKGPDWRPGLRVAHDSGFHWGDERLPEDFGFQWRHGVDEDAPRPAEPPHHPSGFRFGSPAPEADGNGIAHAPDPGAHPSGFRWSENDARVDEGFRWAEGGDRGEPGRAFRWGDAVADPGPAEGRWVRRERPDVDGPSDGFEWKKSG